jgi:hypothetical protein
MRIVRSAIIADVNRPIPPPVRLKPVADAVGIGSYEQRLLKSDVQDFQRAVCLKPDGVFTLDTRLAILKFLNDHQVKDRAFPDRITAKDGTKLRDAFDAGPHCD